MKSAKREGFSLIEMIIAIAIVGIVMSGVLLLITYGTNSMRRTNNQVLLQNQAKDAVTHITTHLQEAADAEMFDEGDKHVMIAAKGKNFSSGVPTSLDVSFYWRGKYDVSAEEKEEVIYFAEVEYPKDSRFGSLGGRDKLEFKKDDGSDGLDKQYFTDKGDINYDTFIEEMKAQFEGWDDSKLFGGQDKRTFILCKNIDVFQKGDYADDESGGTEATPTPDPSTVTPTPTPDPGATPSPTPVVVSDKSLKFTLKLETQNGTTTYKTTKTVYLRNQ